MEKECECVRDVHDPLYSTDVDVSQTSMELCGLNNNQEYSGYSILTYHFPCVINNIKAIHSFQIVP